MTSTAEKQDRTGVVLPTESMTINIGPVHPAMHGTIRMVMDLDGETLVNLDVQPGYLHRGFEKSCERGTWAQVFPYADRLNYVSPMLNNVGWSLAVEKLLDIEVPERCQYYRVVLGELSRIADHLTRCGAACLELQAMTPFLYGIEARELTWDLMEILCGARVTSNESTSKSVKICWAENKIRRISAQSVSSLSSDRMMSSSSEFASISTA